MEADPAAWAELAAAIVVASVAFVGLIFVAISINLEPIITFGGVADYAFAGLLLLTALSVSAILLLVPGQALGALGLELLVLGLVILAGAGRLFSNSYRMSPVEQHTNRLRSAIIGVSPAVLFVICGASVLAGVGGGLYWLVPAWIIGIVSGILNAWVLLVEVKR